MKAGDYNPVHIHQGKLFGRVLSSVMVLKLPKDMGPELTRPDQPHEWTATDFRKCLQANL